MTKEVVGVFVRFRAPLHQRAAVGWLNNIPLQCFLVRKLSLEI
jgi:hypothetical protein